MSKTVKLYIRLAVHGFLTALLIMVIGDAKTAPKDMEVEGYIAEFESLTQGVNSFLMDTVSYQFDVFEPTGDGIIMATCNPLLNNIKINLIMWRQIPKLNRKLLIWHELGHCVAHRQHNDHKFSDGCYVSIMASETQQSHCNWKYENNYKRELQSW